MDSLHKELETSFEVHSQKKKGYKSCHLQRVHLFTLFTPNGYWPLFYIFPDRSLSACFCAHHI